MPALRNLYLSCLALGSIAVAQQDSPTNPTVTIDTGSIQGRTAQLANVDTVVNQFLGIPFGQPPIDDLRFAGPREVESWNTTLQVTTQPPGCLQYLGPEGPGRDFNNMLFNNPPLPSQSEDCLYLNVYVPQGGEANKSVLFWIYGGSNIIGGAALPLYDGTSFAANQDIIVVVPNYRLNVFGSPRAPGIPIEEATISQLDINFALNWTARNIEQFGGDPNKVTIMGESAGALAVGNLVNTVPNNPPFRAAIEMSGSSVVNPIDFSGSDPDAAWPALVELLNCTNTSDEAVLTCMRALPADTIQTAMNENQLMFTPQPPNNITILEAPDEVWAEGNVARVPLLIGYTGDDGGVFVREPAALATATNLSFADALTALNLPKSVTDILTTAYSPGSPFAPDVNTTQDAFFKFATDITFGCTSGFVANITSRLLDVPVWEYVFDAVVPSNTFADYPELGAWHAGELALLFGNYQRPNATELDTQVSQRFQKHFADFIKDPERGPGWEQWPQIGIIGVADGQAVTTTENVQQYNPVCQQYENLWLATEVPALAQAQPQPPQEGNGGQQEEEAVPSMASACSISGLSTLVVAVLFAVALI